MIDYSMSEAVEDIDTDGRAWWHNRSISAVIQQ